MIAGPAGRDPEQGEGVAAARQGEGQRMRNIGLKPLGETPADPADPGRIGGRQPALRAGQAKRVRSSPARVRTEALAAVA